jgi:hypothetical protein
MQVQFIYYQDLNYFDYFKFLQMIIQKYLSPNMRVAIEPFLDGI